MLLPALLYLYEYWTRKVSQFATPFKSTTTRPLTPQTAPHFCRSRNSTAKRPSILEIASMLNPAEVQVREAHGFLRGHMFLCMSACSSCTSSFLAALAHVLSSGVGKADIPISREDFRTTPLRDALRYDVRTVGYNFEDIDPSKGRPLPQIDEQWLNLLNGAHEVRVSEEQMAQSNLSSIMLADGSEDHIVQPIAYHMLHCPYSIYKYAHPDFYGDDPSEPAWIVKHTDHCVDNLRQFVQCHAGTGVSTFKWLDSRKLPWPILNTEETCIDWDHYDGWVRDHSVDIEDIKTMKDGHLLAHPTFGPIYREDYLPKNSKTKNEHDGHS